MYDKADKECCHSLEVGPEVVRKLAGAPVEARLELLGNMSKMES